MYSLLKKELKTFFGSLTGYLVILFFLLITGLFLWVFPGIYNILDNGYATLNGFFSLAPWLYLFLVPATTMRLFAEEKKSGTLELLLSHPISDFKIILAKFLAGMLLIFFSLLPSLFWFLSIYLLGNPIGSIDTGATWGSFIGLFFLAAIYVGIGIFSSSLTNNQVTSFLVAMVISFVFYTGFDFLAELQISYFLEKLFSWLSIDSHYLSISRGIIDLRDIIYFVGMTFFSLWLTKGTLRKYEWKNNFFLKKTGIITILIATIFIISNNILFRVDLTTDKRYSLSPISANISSQLEHPVEIELYLAGELEPELKKLQQEIIEKIAVINVYSPKKIRIRINDPYTITNNKKREKFLKKLIDKGIKPTSFRHKTKQGVNSRLIFPGAIIRYDGNETPVNFLKYNPDFTHELNFNHSAETVEFEIINAFQKLMCTKRSTISFLTGHNEANRFEVYDFTTSLTKNFHVNRVRADSLFYNKKKTDILIIADPKHPFSEKDKFFIDQYIMSGGKVIWLVDPIQVSLDSLSTGHTTMAFPRDLNINDQLFKYGVRLNYELLQDVECARLRVNTAPIGTPPQFTLHPWYYSPLLIPNDNHPLSRNLNRVFSEFVSSIDTVSASPEIDKKILLSTSPYARSIKSPSTVSLYNINNPPAREYFNQSFISTGIILEGSFTSVFKNRMTEAFNIPPAQVINKSIPTKIVVIADGGLIKNHVDYSTNPPRIQELGYDRVSGQVFGNKNFLLNTIHYLNDEDGIMQLRARTQKLRLLDKVKIRENKHFYQWLNILFPILLPILFGVVYTFIRKRYYKR